MTDDSSPGKSKRSIATPDRVAHAILFLAGLGFGAYAWLFHAGQAEASVALTFAAAMIVLSVMFERFNGDFSIGPRGLTGTIGPIERRASKDARVERQAQDVANVVVSDFSDIETGLTDRVDANSEVVYQSVVSEFVQMNDAVLSYFRSQGWRESSELRREAEKAVRGVQPDYVLTRNRLIKFLEIKVSRTTPNIYFAEGLTSGFDALKQWAVSLDFGASAAFVYKGPSLNPFVVDTLLGRRVEVYQVGTDGDIQELRIG